MSTQGPNAPATITVPIAVGTIWTNPNNAKVDDGSYATSTPGGVGSGTRALQATGFGFTIPAGATINGILCEIKRILLSGSVLDGRVSVIKGGSVQTADRKVAGIWPVVADYISYGGPNDLWGTTWTVANINASTFGFEVIANGSGEAGGTCGVDAMRITIFYNNYQGSYFKGVKSFTGVSAIKFA